MASGAAALGISLGGRVCYNGEPSERPVLGSGRAPQLGDIEACFALQKRVLYVFVTILLGIALC